MHRPRLDAPQRSTPSPVYAASRASLLLRAEIALREAGRALELSLNEDHQRLARVAFRLASRVRSDRGAA